MFEDLVARPERLEEHAALLVDLHDRLHRLGIRHRDLHPQNVILAGSGPTVIDWEAADEGDPSVDIAETWVLLAAAELQPEIARARDRFLAIFLRYVDRDAARASLAGVVANRQRDPHMTATELERMAALLVEEGLSASSWPGGSPSTYPPFDARHRELNRPGFRGG
jgi:aminoglycoside phosphotransferase (APT) family kinase protein